MTDHTQRFSGKAEQYAQYRPGYPPACLQFIRDQFNIDPSSTIADIGSGTGILSELLLDISGTVIGVEPNDQMRSTAEKRISAPRFISIDGTGEHTNLKAGSVDLITVAQAFHWMDAVKAKTEFKRILKPGAGIAILWNIIATTTPFEKEYEHVKEKFGKDYIQVRKSHQPDLGAFFNPKKYKLKKFPHFIVLDREGLNGLISSSSFMPTAAHEHYDAMTKDVNNLFNRYNENGLVRINYETELHYGV